MLRTVTGSSGGETPIQDSTVRGGLPAAISAVLLVFGSAVGIDAADVGVLAPAILFFSFFLWGVWDRIDQALIARADAPVLAEIERRLSPPGASLCGFRPSNAPTASCVLASGHGGAHHTVEDVIAEHEDDLATDGH